MESILIDMNLVRENLPDRAVVKPIKKGNTLALEIKVEPSMNERDFEIAKEKQLELIGSENITEIYTEETGHHWYVFLWQTKPVEFFNCTDQDEKSLLGIAQEEGSCIIDASETKTPNKDAE